MRKSILHPTVLSNLFFLAPLFIAITQRDHLMIVSVILILVTSTVYHMRKNTDTADKIIFLQKPSLKNNYIPQLTDSIAVALMVIILTPRILAADIGMMYTSLMALLGLISILTAEESQLPYKTGHPLWHILSAAFIAWVLLTL